MELVEWWWKTGSLEVWMVDRHNFELSSFEAGLRASLKALVKLLPYLRL